MGQVGNLRADCQSAQTARVNNPLQDGILPHVLKLTHYRGRTLSIPDVIIAATALAYRLVLMTDNRKDFPMPQLAIFPLPESR